MSKRRGKRRGKRRERTDGKYWFLSPHAWQYPCNECDDKHSAAFKRRRRGRPLSVCQDCIDRLGIRPRVSRALKETGGKVNPVTVTFVDPATLKSAAASKPESEIEDDLDAALEYAE